MSWQQNRVRVPLECTEPSLAVQSQKAESDINNIVRDFGVTGHVRTSVVPPSYGDFSGVDDYRTAVEAVREAEASFMALPSAVRDRFHHDPQAFLDFCENRENLPQLREWGLAPALPKGDPAAT